MPDSTESVASQIRTLIAQEIAAFPVLDHVGIATVNDFEMALREPREVVVNFAGGLTQTCWSVTHTDGCYRVIYLPKAGCFSLCVESDFGPLDIGVHGDAIRCYASV